MKRLALLLLPGLVAGCGGEGAGPGEQADVARLREAPLALGRWSVGTLDDVPAAVFGPEPGVAHLLVYCDAGRLRLVRAGRVSGGAGHMRVVTDAGEELLDARRAPERPDMVEALLPLDRPVGQRIASGPVRIGVAVDRGALLVTPGDARVATFARDCAGR